MHPVSPDVSTKVRLSNSKVSNPQSVELLSEQISATPSAAMIDREEKVAYSPE